MGFQAFFIYFDWRIQRSIEHKIWKFKVVESSPSIPIHNTTLGPSQYKGNIPVYHFCRPPPLHTPLCSGASGFWSFTVQSLLIIVLQQFKSFSQHVLNRNYNLHTSEARQFSFYWYETFFETWSSLASVPRTSVLWRWLQNSSSISETMKENILISPQPFAIVGCSVAKVKMLVASSVSVVQYRNLHNTHNKESTSFVVDPDQICKVSILVSIL